MKMNTYPSIDKRLSVKDIVAQLDSSSATFSDELYTQMKAVYQKLTG